MPSPYPVIDIFAGPGGLGEGFASLRRRRRGSLFHVCLSIEKDSIAYQTLLLRAFYRQFRSDKVPGAYYKYLRGKISRDKLFELYPTEAQMALNEAWHKELCEENHEEIRRRITQQLDGANAWVLIGGPPCQAYSIAGRSRMKGVDLKKYENDERHYLYREYLKIIADHRPPVFVMENVKGMLSSTVSGKRIFLQIHKDLEHPLEALGTERSNGTKQSELTYRIYSLVRGENLFNGFEPGDYVIKAEDYGVPQTRHRVILLGIRSDLKVLPRTLVPSTPRLTLEEIISDLPKLRSILSRVEDSSEKWVEAVRSIRKLPCFGQNGGSLDREFWAGVANILNCLEAESLNTGGEFVRTKQIIRSCSAWYYDKRLGGVCNHSARAHIVDDLNRYLFAACYAATYQKSPELQNFPEVLLPNHKNVKSALEGELFNDRFRVQLWKKPATTITSHISKDGHYYIHPDPAQCRSLTVREAARLQTFPDNYFFEGPRTSQYQQVGNAVPPLLARQIAEVVFEVLQTAEKL